jgi:hypothetical protein
LDWIAWWHIGKTFRNLTFVPIFLIVKDEFLLDLAAFLFVNGSLSPRWPEIGECAKIKQEQFLP